jgi:hypothetical protein
MMVMGVKWMSDKAIRLIRILLTIPEAPKKVSTREIADRIRVSGFDVTARTIQRDLVELSKHFPLVCDKNNPPGWSFMKGSQRIQIPTPKKEGCRNL